MKAAQDLYGIPIEEENDFRNASQRELLKRFAELSTLSQFLQTFDSSILNRLQAVNREIDLQNDFKDEQQAAAMEHLAANEEATFGMKGQQTSGLAFDGQAAGQYMEAGD